MQHVTVLLEEAVSALNLSEDSIVVDATLGAGGHSALIAQGLGTKGHLIALDADTTAVESAKKIFKDYLPKVSLVNKNFRELPSVLEAEGVSQVDAILADLGWRTDQFLVSGRGFSFNDEKDLLMTYGPAEDYPFTAKEMVNTWEEENLADIIYGYGEERSARKIAKAIVERREVTPFTNAKDLADCISEALPKGRFSKTNPATKTFQALRIAVNDELGVLEKFITDSFTSLNEGGRLVIITFHSLEDRVVKHRFRELAQSGEAHLVSKKPITPSFEEVKNNPRARSAKMRILEKLPT